MADKVEIFGIELPQDPDEADDFLPLEAFVVVTGMVASTGELTFRYLKSSGMSDGLVIGNLTQCLDYVRSSALKNWVGGDE